MVRLSVYLGPDTQAARGPGTKPTFLALASNELVERILAQARYGVAPAGSRLTAVLGPCFTTSMGFSGEKEADARLPASLRRRSDLEAIREDLQPYRGTTSDERSEIVSKLCRSAAEQIAAHPDGRRILEFQEPLPAESAALWLRMVAEARNA